MIRHVPSLPSLEGYYLTIRFKINERPIVNDNTGYAIQTCIVIANDSKIIFTKDSQEIQIKVAPTNLRWLSNEVVDFTAKITASDVEHISKWTEGKTFVIGWEISGYALIEPRWASLERPLPFNISSTSLPASQLPTISPELFDEKFAKAVNLPSHLFYEFPLDVPQTLKTRTFSEAVLEELKRKLIQAATLIQTTTELHRKAKNSLEYKNAMGEVRLAIDDLRRSLFSSLANKSFHQDKVTVIAQKLFLDTGIFDGAGALESAEDLVRNIWLSILDPLFDTSSKTHHAVTRSNKSYSMYPTRNDSEYVMLLSVSTIGYLLRKLANVA